MAFHSIQPEPGLAPARRRRANRRGPPAVAIRTNYPSLLRSAGFVDIESRDDTAEYLATQLRWIEACARHEEGMRAAMGDETFDESLETRVSTLQAIEEGLLVRYRYTAAR